MFFRPKGAKEGAAPATGPLHADQPAPERAPAEPGGAAAPPAVAAAPAADQALPPAEMQRRAEASERLAATVGEVVGLMIRSPRHREHKVSDLAWLALPAVRTGQCAVIQAQSRTNGFIAPVAAVLWARVSAEVDKRLSEKLDEPIRLAPREWRSGDILWLVDAIGDNQAIAAVVQRLRASEWKERPVKARVTDADGQVRLRLIEPKAMPGAAAAPAQ